MISTKHFVLKWMLLVWMGIILYGNPFIGRGAEYNFPPRGMGQMRGMHPWYYMRHGSDFGITYPRMPSYSWGDWQVPGIGGSFPDQMQSFYGYYSEGYPYAPKKVY